mmetsp:Transcript_53768/g.109350  ORF Transcript_53768/g.109350 Transcript_53768/m.109350 type:complete len:340 (+) Transcript_53768:574-1593(+)
MRVGRADGHKLASGVELDDRDGLVSHLRLADRLKRGLVQHQHLAVVGANHDEAAHAPVRGAAALVGRGVSHGGASAALLLGTVASLGAVGGIHHSRRDKFVVVEGPQGDHVVVTGSDSHVAVRVGGKRPRLAIEVTRRHNGGLCTFAGGRGLSKAERHHLALAGADCQSVAADVQRTHGGANSDGADVLTPHGPEVHVAVLATADHVLGPRRQGGDVARVRLLHREQAVATEHVDLALQGAAPHATSRGLRQAQLRAPLALAAVQRLLLAAEATRTELPEGAVLDTGRSDEARLRRPLHGEHRVRSSSHLPNELPSGHAEGSQGVVVVLAHRDQLLGIG